MEYNLLEVDVLSILDEHAVGYKIIFHTGVDLHDVTTLSTNIQIMDLGTLQVRWPRTNCKGMGSTETKSKLI